ncbi:MAG TPA: hypothetical protein VNZ63_08455 [Verrucomicrobiae bacterium]|jgi:hypothetical protein|nr:hypothetical protein [Verrucomicrobiae bacterium]
MELATELRRALDCVCAAGAPEVRENGEWLAGLDGVQYEVRAEGDAALLHLWSAEQSLVRRVIRVAEETRERVVLEVSRFGYSRNAQLEIVADGQGHETRRVEREQFSGRFRRLLTDHFPDETVESLSTSADLHHSISGSYTRGLVRRGSSAHAVLSASPHEDTGTIDGILTFGLIWLQHTRDHARRCTVQGLRLFLPHRTSTVTAHRMTALASPEEVELYEYEPVYWRVRKIARSNAGNLDTWIVARREIEQAIAGAMPLAERIRAMAPEAIRIGVAPATRDVTLRFRGMEFARWRQGEMWYGLGDHQQILTPGKWPALEALVRQLDLHRHALASDTKHRLYRAQPERWLETMVAADPARIDARLDPRHVYAQVPAFSSGDRGIIDLLAATRDGRLAILELKASEDIHLVMQAADYWLRVRFHHAQDEFRRYGYFPEIQLNAKPPLLFLVAPGFRFHPSMDIVLRYLSSEIEISRIALVENWRGGLKVIFRQ